MKSHLFITVILLNLILAGCASTHTYPVPDYVVSSIELPVSAEKAKETLLLGFNEHISCRDHWYIKYGFTQENKCTRFEFNAEDRNNILAGQKYFNDPANADDLFLPFWDIDSSYYYSSIGKYWYYHVSFGLSIKPIDSNHCKISVRSIDGYESDGPVFLAASHALVLPARKPVAPAPQDEYRVLMVAAHLLGFEIKPLESQ